MQPTRLTLRLIAIQPPQKHLSFGLLLYETLMKQENILSYVNSTVCLIHVYLFISLFKYHPTPSLHFPPISLHFLHYPVINTTNTNHIKFFNVFIQLINYHIFCI